MSSLSSNTQTIRTRLLTALGICLLVGPAHTVELEHLARWAWAPASQLEWLGDSAFVAACGPTLQGWRITETGTLQPTFEFELPVTPQDLESQGGDLLAALGSQGLARIRFDGQGQPWLHHINSMEDVPSEIGSASSMAASSNGEWLLTHTGHSAAVWRCDSTGMEVYRGHTYGTSDFTYAKLSFVDSIAWIGGSGHSGFYWGYVDPRTVGGEFDPVTLIDGFWSGMELWSALCGHVFFSMSSYLLEPQLASRRFDLTYADQPVLQDTGLFFPAQWHTWGESGWLYSPCWSVSGLQRCRVPASGMPEPVDTLHRSIHQLELQNGFAVASNYAGQILHLRTDDEDGIQVLDEVTPVHRANATCWAPGGAARILEDGFQPLLWSPGNIPITAEEPVPLPGIVAHAGTSERLFLADDSLLWMFHGLDAEGVAQALSTPCMGVLGLLMLGDTYLGVKLSDEFRVYTFTSTAGFTLCGSMAGTGPEDLFAGDDTALFHLDETGIVNRHALVDGVPQSAIEMLSVTRGNDPELLFSSGTLALLTGTNRPVRLFAVSSGDALTELPAPDDWLNSLLSLNDGLLLGADYSTTLLLEIGNLQYQTLVHAYVVTSGQFEEGVLLLDHGTEGVEILRIPPSACVRPQLGITKLPGNRLRLDWNACETATGYRLEWAAEPYGSWSTLLTTAFTSAELVLAGPGPFFRVFALQD